MSINRLKAPVIASAAAFASISPAFAGQGLSPQLQGGGLIVLLNNFAGMFGPFWQFMMWGAMIAGVAFIIAAIVMMKNHGDQQKRAQNSVPKIAFCGFAGACLLGLAAFSNQSVQTFFGSGYNTQQVQENNTNPFQ